jgi:hypothetical protein
MQTFKGLLLFSGVIVFVSLGVAHTVSAGFGDCPASMNFFECLEYRAYEGDATSDGVGTTVTCNRECNPIYYDWEGLVTLNLQCDENSPQSYTASLEVNGVQTPINTKVCPSVDIAVTGCSIALDQSNCMGTVEWEFHDAMSPYEVKNVVQGFADDIFGTEVSGTEEIVLQHGDNRIEAYSASQFVGVVTETVSCDTGLEWSSSKQKCVVPNVDLTLFGCEIAIGESSCVGSVNWNFLDALSPYSVKHIVSGFPDEIIGTEPSNSNKSVDWQYGINTVQAVTYVYIAETKNIRIKCEDWLTWSIDEDKCIDAHIPVLTLTADPSIVRKGETTTLSWTISDMVQNTCTINGSGLSDFAADVPTGDIDSGPLTALSRFTLTCSSPLHDDTVESVDVKVIPTMYEM